MIASSRSRSALRLFIVCVFNLSLLPGCEADSSRDAPKAAGSGAIQWHLPKQLREISGLVALNDEEVFAVNDERARIFGLNPQTGAVTRQFVLGDKPLRGDFEGITLHQGMLYLVTSNGVLYAVELDNTDSYTAPKRYDLELNALCELEGLAAEPGTPRLWVVCKTCYPKTDQPAIYLYAWSTATQARQPSADVRIALGDAKQKFSPSGLVFSADAQQLYVVAAKQAALAKIDWSPNPAVQSIAQLPTSPAHRQTEGIALLSNNHLLLADEGGKKSGRLTRYPASLWHNWY